jgi:hypothetical protein
MTIWNHRVLRTRDKIGDELLEFVEVHYDEHGNLQGYSAPFLCGESLEELLQLTERLRRALQSSVLNVSEFPARH